MNRFFYKFQILTAVLFFLTVQFSYSQENSILIGERPQQISINDGSSGYSTDQTSFVAREAEALPFYEGFEAETIIPAGWTQEVVNGPLWNIGNGNLPFPANAYAGNNNLVFRSHIPYATGLITRLVSPPLDLTGTETAVMKFHYVNAGIYNFYLYLDRLTIKYKASLGDEWTTIETFHDDLTVWTEVSIILPNPSDTYYIAFEAESNAGIGISIDEIIITEQQAAGFFITAGAGDNGSINPSGLVFVPAGETQQFNMEAEDGHHISSLLVDNAAISEAEGESQYTFTFEPVNSGHTIMAYFSSNTYSVKVDVVPPDAGSVSMTGAPFWGNTIELSAEPSGSNYIFSHWTSDGIIISMENPFSFVLQSDTVFQAHFSIATGLVSTLSERLKVYPNPAHDYLNLDLPADAFVQVFDLQGRLQFEANLPAGNKGINFSGFDQAMYIIKLQFEDQLLTKRILHF